MTFIALVGWEKFQHYGDRDPTWIKLYRDLLTSESWVLGTDISRLMQVASAMLAARYKNKIPYRWDLIKKVAHLDFSEAQFKGAIQHLLEHKFLEIQQVTTEENLVEQSASTALAKCSSEESREEEKREEKKRSGGCRAKARRRSGVSGVFRSLACGVPAPEGIARPQTPQGDPAGVGELRRAYAPRGHQRLQALAAPHGPERSADGLRRHFPVFA